MVTTYLTNLFVNPSKTPVFDTPENHGLDYEDVEFPARDGLTIRGWLLRGSTDRVVIQNHFGIQACRAGYTPDGKGPVKPWNDPIRFLTLSKALVDAGYTVLTYDMRNHGESDKTDPALAATGASEYQDVLGAVDYIASHPDYAEASIGLMAICMGCNSATIAFGADGGLHDNPRIKAMVGVQPLETDSFMEEMRIPRFLIDRVDTKVKSLGGHGIHAGFQEHVAMIDVPTLVIQNKNDAYADMDAVNAYYEALGSKTPIDKDIEWPELDRARLAGYDYITKNPGSIINWFDTHMT